MRTRNNIGKAGWCLKLSVHGLVSFCFDWQTGRKPLIKRGGHSAAMMGVPTLKDEKSVILLIENDDNDIFFFKRALATAGWEGTVRVVGSTTEARSYIANEHPYTDTRYYQRPHLIVSDFRLTGQTALGFVEWLRNEASFDDIPIVVMSGAASGSDVEKLTKVGARGFIKKTGDVPALASAIKAFLPA